MRRARGLLVLGALSLGTSIACGPSEDRPPPFPGGSSGGRSPTGGSGGGSSDCEGPPKPGDTGPCGNQIVPVVQEKPSLYFVLDASGSMASRLEDASGTRMAAAKSAITDVLHELGHRIRYGLAAYPGFGVDACAAGVEIFETAEGDPLQCVNKRRAGPVLRSFIERLSAITPGGGTSIAATLDTVRPLVSELDGKTFVVLVTDGAPNCNAEAECEASECMLNNEGMSFQGTACDDDFNCCDPALVGEESARLNCVDRDATLDAVTALREAGVDTYVIGVPGSEFYASLLDQLAVAGGTAREDQDRAYYPATDTESLAATLKTIGTSVATSCDITLQDARYIDKSTINVYFDATLIPSDDEDGWTYDAPTIALHGEPCRALLAGEVVQVQVVAGCPTIIK